MTNSAAHLQGALTNRYCIERELGRGGMATVYLARDIRHGRNVAVKVLRPELAAVIGAERHSPAFRVSSALVWYVLSGKHLREYRPPLSGVEVDRNQPSWHTSGTQNRLGKDQIFASESPM